MSTTRQLELEQLAGEASAAGGSARNPPPIERCPRCGSTTFRDFPARRGQWIRRDCAMCGRTMRFITVTEQPGSARN